MKKFLCKEDFPTGDLLDLCGNLVILDYHPWDQDITRIITQNIWNFPGTYMTRLKTGIHMKCVISAKQKNFFFLTENYFKKPRYSMADLLLAPVCYWTGRSVGTQYNVVVELYHTFHKWKSPFIFYIVIPEFLADFS